MNNKANRAFIIFIVILSLVTGVLGGVGGVALVLSSGTIQRLVGINSNGNVNLPSSQKVENVMVKEDSSTVDAVNKVSPAVVSVIFTKDVQVINPFSFGFGSGGLSQPQTQVQKQQGGGSGFVITSDGYIATNRHVAEIDGAKYSVITQDGKKYDAKVVALDPAFDFAVLKIEAKNLPVVDFGDSDNLDIGQKLIAIGNALGEFQNTVTVGVLSGKQRSIQAGDSSGTSSSTENLEGLLQTDAAINEGNSGGPLVNLKGQVIGVNVATAAKGQSEGIGFAIPINYLKPAVDSIKKSGKIIRPYLGIRYATVDQKIAAIKGIEADKGVIVLGNSDIGQSGVVKDSPADKAGIKEGDVILKINNDDLGQGNSLVNVLSKYHPGDEVTLQVLRDGKKQDIKVKLGEMGS